MAAPHDELVKLYYKCKGEQKDLYVLIGLDANPDFERLSAALRDKQRAWRGRAGTYARVEIVELALKLLKTPADQDRYARVVQKMERQGAWGSQGGADAQVAADEETVAKFFEAVLLPITFTVNVLGKYFEVLAKALANVVDEVSERLIRLVEEDSLVFKVVMNTVAVAIVSTAFVLLLERVLPDVAEEEGGGAPGASTGTETEIRRPSSSARETNISTSSESSGPTEMERRVSARPPAAAASPLAAEAEEPSRPDPQPVSEPVRVGDDVPHPRKVRNMAPEYPRLARLRRSQGIVVLDVTVDRQGDVSNVSVLRSAAGFDEAAVEAVREWRYEPTILNGRSVSVIFTETVRFEIGNPNPPR